MKETISTIQEGVLGLTVVAGSFYLLGTKISDPTVIAAIIGSALSAVLTFYFSQRQTTKAVNGNISALATIASQVSQAREQAIETAATTALKAAQQTPGAPPNA